MLIKSGIQSTELDFRIRYHDRVRQTIASFDTLVVDILAKGATLVIAILIGPWSLLHFSNGALTSTEVESIFKWVSWVSIAAVFASAYVTFAVSLYADLLKRSVELGTRLEAELFENPAEGGLTTILDESLLAAGRGGQYLYAGFAFVLYIGTAITSMIYVWLAGRSIRSLASLVVVYGVVLVALIAWVIWSWTRPRRLP